MAKVGKFCLAKRVKVEWLFQAINAALGWSSVLNFWVSSFVSNIIQLIKDMNSSAHRKNRSG